MLVNLAFSICHGCIQLLHLLLDEGFASLEFGTTKKLLFQAVLGFFHLVFQLATLFFLVDLVEILVVQLLFKPVHCVLALVVLALRLVHLFLGTRDLAQVPLNDLHPVVVHLVRSVDELTHVQVADGGWVEGQVRHQTHVVELADFALLLLQLDLVSYFLLVCVG